MGFETVSNLRGGLLQARANWLEIEAAG